MVAKAFSFYLLGVYSLLFISLIPLSVEAQTFCRAGSSSLPNSFCVAINFTDAGEYCISLRGSTSVFCQDHRTFILNSYLDSAEVWIGTINSGWVFTEWDDSHNRDRGCSGTSHTITITAPSDRPACTAIFKRPNIRYSIEPEGSGKVCHGSGSMRSCQASEHFFEPEGTTVRVMAEPNSEWRFVRWRDTSPGASSSDCSHSNTVADIVAVDRGASRSPVCVAVFRENRSTIAFVGSPPRGGKVCRVADSNRCSIAARGGTPGSVSRTIGGNEELVATANPDWTFSHWMDLHNEARGCTGNTNPVTISVLATENQPACTAVFLANDIRLRLRLFLEGPL